MVEEREYSSNEEQLVVFKLAREEYGVSILNVQEIKRIGSSIPDLINEGDVIH